MEQAHVDESHNTLEFATRAKRVVNTVSATETVSQAALLKRQGKQIEELKDQLRNRGYGQLSTGRDLLVHDTDACLAPACGVWFFTLTLYTVGKL